MWTTTFQRTWFDRATKVGLASAGSARRLSVAVLEPAAQCAEEARLEDELEGERLGELA